MKNNPYPLAKTKTYWADTILSACAVMEELGHTPPFTPQTRNQYKVKSLEELALLLAAIGKSFHEMRWEVKGEWGPWWQLKSMLHTPRDTPIGHMVYILDSSFGNRQFSGVGQLVNVTHDSIGNRRYHYDDNGPPSMSRFYTIRLLDGRLQNWTNASYTLIPKHRDITMFREISRKYS